MEEGSVEEAFYLKKKTEEEKGGFDFFFLMPFWEYRLKNTHAN